VTMFWDGRVSGSPEMGFSTPAGGMLPDGLDNVLAVQAMFPVTSRDEMRGTPGERDVFGMENELASIPEDDLTQIWNALMARLLAIPAYQSYFRAAYPDVNQDDLGFQHAANAIAAFEAASWTFDDSPWDQYLSGDESALSNSEKRGAILFYSEAKCYTCHATNLQTDQDFHNIGVPQLGPGKDENTSLDFGRWLVTNDPNHRFSFRTPSLRNVSLTGPWMHNGAYNELDEVVRHHLNPEAALINYDIENLPKELRDSCQVDSETTQMILETLDPMLDVSMELSEDKIADLVIFLHALTSPSAIDLRRFIPDRVPSGLPVRD